MAERTQKKKRGPDSRPSVTVDLVIFTIADNDLRVLLIRRKQGPFRDLWALPGGFVEMDESLEDAAARELKEEVGVENVYLEQLFTFGDPRRDPRGRVISVSYFALVDAERQRIVAASDAADAKWHTVFDLPQLAFDHREILDYATVHPFTAPAGLRDHPATPDR